MQSLLSSCYPHIQYIRTDWTFQCLVRKESNVGVRVSIRYEITSCQLLPIPAIKITALISENMVRF